MPLFGFLMLCCPRPFFCFVLDYIRQDSGADAFVLLQSLGSCRNGRWSAELNGGNSRRGKDQIHFLKMKMMYTKQTLTPSTAPICREVNYSVKNVSLAHSKSRDFSHPIVCEDTPRPLDHLSADQTTQTWNLALPFPQNEFPDSTDFYSFYQ